MKSKKTRKPRKLEQKSVKPQKVLKQPEPEDEILPVLRFTPYAWAKLQWFCHHGETEVGGFGITSSNDLLLIEDFVSVQQDVSIASIAFDDEAVADFFELQVDLGRQPQQFARLWLHTHPGDCPVPSGTDEETFSRVFGHCDWAVMFVLAKGGKTYARLRFNIGPKGEMLIPVEMDYSLPFPASDHEAWELEYDQNIQPLAAVFSGHKTELLDEISWDENWGSELDLMGEAEFLSAIENFDTEYENEVKS